MHQRLALLVVCAAAALWAAGCGGDGNHLISIERGQPELQLPDLSSLPPASGGHAVMAEDPAEYNLLLVDPILASPAGTIQDGDVLSLDPAANDGMAWAIYALPGFPIDGSIMPTAVAVDKTMPEVWVALSNYSSSGWEFKQFVFGGVTPLESGAELFSDTGVMHVAVIGAKTAVDVYSVKVTTSEELPGAPVAVINAPDRILEGFEATFGALGSTSGDGDFSELVWTFDGGSQQTTDDPATEVTHTFATAGLHTVGLTVKNDLARVGHTDLPVDVEAINWVTDVLVVYNSDIPESEDLALYYASPLTGRAIPGENVLGLPMETNDTAISRPNYGDLIREPIKSYLDANSDIKDSILYIVLMKGVPYQINTDSNSAVDSDLCLLYEDDGATHYPYAGAIWSGSSYHDPLREEDFDGSGFFEPFNDTEKGFMPFYYNCADTQGGLYKLSYLVGRISAYTYEEAKQSIDRALVADTSGSGWVIMDTHQGWRGADTMSDPPWPFTAEADCLEELLTADGYNNFLDMEYTVLLSSGLEEEQYTNVIGFCGWGVNHSRNGGQNYPSGKMYILNDLDDFVYLPGAAWIVYESFAGQKFTWDGETSTHASQGQICDFIRMGGTVAIGNCYEPYTVGVPDERRVMQRYLLKGDRWIEAAYKGIRMLSWHTIVLGDPLCRVVAE